MERFRKVMSYLFLWLITWVFWSFIIRAFTTHHPDNALAQGLAADTIA